MKNKTGKSSKRGFAAMSRDKQREIASKGGRAAHQQGTAHEWSPAEARKAAQSRNSNSNTDSYEMDMTE